MKWLLIISLAFIGCAGYHPQPLTKAQIAGEIAFEALHLIDWGQTLDIENHDGMYEWNPLMGRHPSRGRVNLVMGAIAVVHPVITWAIPSEYRWWWIGGSSAASAWAVVHNDRLGLNINF